MFKKNPKTTNKNQPQNKKNQKNKTVPQVEGLQFYKKVV